MAGLTVAKGAYDKIARHLEEIKQNKADIIERYYPSKTPERTEFTEFMENYIDNVTKLIESSSVGDGDGTLAPMSLIGSTVTVLDIEYDEVHNYLIVFPEDFKLEGDDVSLFSPLGQGLILRKVDEVAEINAPAGVIRYKILSVKLDEELT